MKKGTFLSAVFLGLLVGITGCGNVHDQASGDAIKQQAETAETEEHSEKTEDATSPKETEETAEMKETEPAGNTETAKSEIDFETESTEQPEEQRISRKNYYDFDGNLIYYDSYAYYDNGLLCSTTLHSAYDDGNGETYSGDEYTFLYLYDEEGKLENTVLGALTISDWYDETSGRLTLDYDYDEEGNSSELVIYPQSESIEQEKFHVDASKTETIYGDAPVIFTDEAGEWANIYLEDVCGGEALTDMTSARFLYVDDNHVPELWMDYGYGYAGGEVFTAESGTTDKVYISHGSARYIEKSNLLLLSGGHMDAYYDTLYQIKDGKFAAIAEGNYGAPDNSNVQVDENGYPVYEYKWNGETVTEDEYKKNLTSLFDVENAVDIYQNVYTYEQCKLLLQKIADTAE